MDNLPNLKLGDDCKQVKWMRCLLLARGYAPEDLYSFSFDDELADTVQRFKAAKNVGDGPAWNKACWIAILS
ncbi:hypothetical protein [Nonomuraea dietziae]|uniref:hypothetical protein n=1 Tax=Nonomuraea dietziae TaxID=65515 RepID=UPI0033FD2A8E